MLNAGVLGSPIAHSLSPVLHRAGYAALGLRDWRYAAAEVDEHGLADHVAGLDVTWRGLSLTMPLKEVALEVAAEVDETACLTGAVNTLVRRDDGSWSGHNTDVIGLERALSGPVAVMPARDLVGRAALVLGSGATARSAAVALRRLAVSRICVAARREASARVVADIVVGLPGPPVEIDVVPLGDWADVPADVVVSTLPPGASEAVADALRGRHEGTLLDVVYAAWPTPLARAATACGMEVVSGLDMLVHQAGAQFELFTGVPVAPVAAMFAAGQAALAEGRR